MTKLIRTGLLALMLTALPLGLTTVAQTGTGIDRTNTGYNNTRDDDRDWGWLGLFGLAGLAGLLRRRDTHSHGDVSGTSRANVR
jgi:MYXO-CTERM domain-containing protein